MQVLARHRLGGLPLALHLAGSYLASPFARWHTFADYHRALDSVELPAALADLDEPGADDRATIQRTWDLSLDALADGGIPQARQLLFLLSCYAPATRVAASALSQSPEGSPGTGAGLRHDLAEVPAYASIDDARHRFLPRGLRPAPAALVSPVRHGSRHPLRAHPRDHREPGRALDHTANPQPADRPGRSRRRFPLGTILLADPGEDAVDVLNRRLQGSHGNLLADLGDTDLDAGFPARGGPAFRDVLAAELPPHPDERLSAFRHLLTAYGFEKMIPVYDVISGITHLSLEGAQVFFEDRDGAICLWQQPRTGEAAPCEVICLGMQFDTMLAYNELLASRPWTADLAAIAEDHELPAVLATRKPDC